MNTVVYSVLILSMVLTKSTLNQRTLQGFSIETLILFSDAVFAIAITLLAIDIRVPQLAQELIATQLNNEIYGLLPRFISFILTFFIVGSYWISYHRTMFPVKRYDRGLISLNLLFLMFIVLLPFPNDLIGKYPTQQVAVIVYAIFTGATGVSLWLLWLHASRNHRLIDEGLPVVFLKRLNLRLLISPCIFLISIPISFLNPLLSLVTWFLAFPLGVLFERVYLQ
jgi:TMEM175 potassium channel family protein